MTVAWHKKLDDSKSPAGLVHPSINIITDALTFKVARLAARNERAGMQCFKSKHGITVNQWRVLGLTFALGPVSSREVRDVLYMDKGQFSRVVKQLANLGFIHTTINSGDARTVELSLTREGQKFHDKLIEFTTERNEAVVSVLTAQECEEFIRVLDKISLQNDELQKHAGVI